MHESFLNLLAKNIMSNRETIFVIFLLFFFSLMTSKYVSEHSIIGNALLNRDTYITKVYAESADSMSQTAEKKEKKADDLTQKAEKKEKKADDLTQKAEKKEKKANAEDDKNKASDLKKEASDLKKKAKAANKDA